MSKLHDGLSEILEIDVADLNESFELGELWDSLAVVSTLALIDEIHDISVSAEDLAECKTIGDIEALIGAALA